MYMHSTGDWYEYSHWFRQREGGRERVGGGGGGERDDTSLNMHRSTSCILQ